MTVCVVDERVGVHARLSTTPIALASRMQIHSALEVVWRRQLVVFDVKKNPSSLQAIYI